MNKRHEKRWNWLNKQDNDNLHALRTMQHQMEGLMHSVQKNMPWTKARVKPRVDIYETGNNYEITAEMPGVNEKDISLELADNALIITGEKKNNHYESEETETCRSERAYGKFRRVLNLPDDIMPDSTDASFEQGVLKITLKRIPHEEQVHKIDIKKRKAA